MHNVHQRLQGELQCHSSLIHTLRYADENHASRILALLRQGIYDGILLGADLDFKSSDSGDLVYPWEEAVEEERHQQVQVQVQDVQTLYSTPSIAPIISAAIRAPAQLK